MTALFSSTESTGKDSPSSNIVPPFGNRVCQSGEEADVRQLPSAELREEEREAAAYRAGVAMQAWYSRYQATGDRLALSVAHRHLTQMVQILAGRSPEYVAKLEQERGLA